MYIHLNSNTVKSNVWLNGHWQIEWKVKLNGIICEAIYLGLKAKGL